jgi:hypothetical protein
VRLRPLGSQSVISNIIQITLRDRRAIPLVIYNYITKVTTFDPKGDFKVVTIYEYLNLIARLKNRRNNRRGNCALVKFTESGF